MTLKLESTHRPDPEFILQYAEQIIELGKNEICEAKKMPSSDAIQKIQSLLDQLDKEQKALPTTVVSDKTLKARILLELFEAKCMLHLIEYDEKRWQAVSFVAIATIDEAHVDLQKIVDISLRLELLLHISKIRLEAFHVIDKGGAQEKSPFELGWRGTYRIQKSNGEKKLNFELLSYRKNVLNEQNDDLDNSPQIFFMI